VTCAMIDSWITTAKKRSVPAFAMSAAITAPPDSASS